MIELCTGTTDAQWFYKMEWTNFNLGMRRFLPRIQCPIVDGKMNCSNIQTRERPKPKPLKSFNKTQDLFAYHGYLEQEAMKYHETINDENINFIQENHILKSKEITEVIKIDCIPTIVNRPFFTT